MMLCHEAALIRVSKAFLKHVTLSGECQPDVAEIHCDILSELSVINLM